ncbi:hypothetical protein Taro_034442 [Colocasia esculenta]|uniref:Uncharacterized protein n=1 Tax=Colocasia esculenta TaxID=4460 RepID=A0A843VRC7_COLES|nr:hypothetical protein [Colocasia esculenta]
MAAGCPKRPFNDKASTYIYIHRVSIHRPHWTDGPDEQPLPELGSRPASSSSSSSSCHSLMCDCLSPCMQLVTRHPLNTRRSVHVSLSVSPPALTRRRLRPLPGDVPFYKYPGTHVSELEHFEVESQTLERHYKHPCTLFVVSLEMATEQERAEMDARARQGETVVPGGTGGKSLEAQEHLAEGRSRGGQTRREQLGTEGYQEMGRKGGLSTVEQSGGERAVEEGVVPIDESKFRTKRS